MEENVKFTPPNYYAAAFSKISSFLLITSIAMNQAGLELQVNDETFARFFYSTIDSKTRGNSKSLIIAETFQDNGLSLETYKDWFPECKKI